MSENLFSRPEDQPLSLYTYIQNALMQDGSLPPKFSLPKKPRENGGIQFADGAPDGIRAYHMSPGKADIKQLRRVTILVSKEQPQKAEKLLEEFFAGDKMGAMLSCIDALQEWVINHRRRLHAGRLYQFSAHLIENSRDAESIKFALSLLELISPEHDQALCEKIITLSRSDEFTLFCLFVVDRWADHNAIKYDIAQKVRGWGRIHAVDRLSPDSQQIRDWLMTEGFQNDILPTYSAITCLQKAGLLERLRQGALSESQRESVHLLLDTACTDGPVGDIGGREEGETIVACYLDWASNLPLSLAMLNTLSTLFVRLHDWKWPKQPQLISQVCALIKSPAALSFIEQELARGQGYALAKKMGISCEDKIFAAIQADFSNSYHLIDLLLPDENFIDACIDLFREKLPLREMSTGPADEKGYGPAFENYHILVYLVQYLRFFPGKGEPLLICCLHAPVIQCRNLSLTVLQEWKKAGTALSDALIQAVSQLRNNEVTQDIKKRLAEEW